MLLSRQLAGGAAKNQGASGSSGGFRQKHSGVEFSLCSLSKAKAAPLTSFSAKLIRGKHFASVRSSPVALVCCAHNSKTVPQTGLAADECWHSVMQHSDRILSVCQPEFNITAYTCTDLSTHTCEAERLVISTGI